MLPAPYMQTTDTSHMHPQAHRRQTEDFDIVALSSSWVSDSIGVVIGIPRFVKVSEENATT